jgi:hypothetical protein
MVGFYDYYELLSISCIHSDRSSARTKSLCLLPRSMRYLPCRFTTNRAIEFQYQPRRNQERHVRVPIKIMGLRGLIANTDVPDRNKSLMRRFPPIRTETLWHTPKQAISHHVVQISWEIYAIEARTVSLARPTNRCSKICQFGFVNLCLAEVSCQTEAHGCSVFRCGLVGEVAV